jgi:hypothetical protein
MIFLFNPRRPFPTDKNSMAVLVFPEMLFESLVKIFPSSPYAKGHVLLMLKDPGLPVQKSRKDPGISKNE